MKFGLGQIPLSLKNTTAKSVLAVIVYYLVHVVANNSMILIIISMKLRSLRLSLHNYILKSNLTHGKLLKME